MAALFISLSFAFTNSFLHKYRVKYYDYIVKGPFKCYVTQMGVGGVSDFLEKSVTKV